MIGNLNPFILSLNINKKSTKKSLKVDTKKSLFET